MTDVKCVWDGKAVLGEGPIWVGEEGALYWVDIKNPTVYRMRLSDNGVESWPMPDRVGFIVPRQSGGFLVGLKSGLASWSPGADVSMLVEPEPDRPNNRFNDALVDGRGRLWAGTMDDNEAEPTGWLYRFDGPQAFHRVDGPYSVTNGPGISPDGRTLYHTDTFGRKVYALDVAEDGSLSGKRLFVELADGTGYPDGTAVDREGGVWICHWGGWCISRFAPDGSFLSKIDMPAAQITSCIFAGAGLDRLFVTSARIGLDDAALEAQPLAGGVFEIDPGVVGTATGKAAF